MYPSLIASRVPICDEPKSPLLAGLFRFSRVPLLVTRVPTSSNKASRSHPRATHANPDSRTQHRRLFQVQPWHVRPRFLRYLWILDHHDCMSIERSSGRYADKPVLWPKKGLPERFDRTLCFVNIFSLRQVKLTIRLLVIGILAVPSRNGVAGAK